MRNATEYFVLIANVVHLLGLNEVCLFHDLDAGVFVSVFFLDEPHCPERTWMSQASTFAKDRKHLVILEVNLSVAYFFTFLLHPI
jgi:hypothetical protein